MSALKRSLKTKRSVLRWVGSRESESTPRLSKLNFLEFGSPTAPFFPDYPRPTFKGSREKMGRLGWKRNLRNLQHIVRGVVL